MDPRLNSLIVAQQLQARTDHATAVRTVRDVTRPRPQPNRRSVLAWLPRRAHA